MATTELLRTASHRHRELMRAMAAELRRLRLDRGLSQRIVALAAGIDPSMLSRIEAGHREPSFETLVALSAALGAEPSVRLYPAAGPRIFDHVQARILEAVLRIAHPRWLPRIEVTVTRPSRGVIDVVFNDPVGADIVATEVQGQLRRAEQQVRWAGMKADALPSARDWPWGARAEPRVHRLLVLRSTEASRTVVRSLPELFRAAYPVPEAAAYRALTSDTDAWPGNALLWADVDAERTRILRRAPRDVGRN
jgi:transcriptional regulator with XRE-family HTH domain